MGVFTTDGLIIKEQKVKESDRLITILTKDKGIIRAFAPRAMSIRSKNVSATQLLAYSRLTIFEGRDTYKINEAASHDIFMDLRRDVSALFLAGYLCELVYTLSPMEEDSQEYLNLILRALYLMSKKTLPLSQIKSVCELRLCTFSGYMPNLECCGGCGGSSENMFFDATGGGLLCSNCNKYGSIPLSSGVLSAMRYIISAESGKEFSFKLSDAGLSTLGEICEKFTLSQTERGYKSLDMYKNMEG